MKKIIRIFTVLAIVVFESLLTNALNQTTDHSPARNATMPPSLSTALQLNHKNSSELLERSSFEVSSSLKVAEPRQFPVGSPNLIPSPSNLVSPFDVSSFGKQLLPLINVNIKEKVKDFARTFNDGADFIEDAIRESWKESPLNPHNFPNLLETPNIFKHSQSSNGLRKPVVQLTKAQKGKAPKAIETYSTDNLLHEYGIDGYKHFEESILRELEKQEERKVEATIHTLFEQGSRVEIVHGKPYDYKSGWSPVAAPTKNYAFESETDVNSQIISPLHTSIFSSSQEASSAPFNFHDFDNLSGHNTIHSTYSVNEEAGESKVKPVKARITPVRKVTPSPITTKSSTTKITAKPRYRKRQNSSNNSTVTHNRQNNNNSVVNGSSHEIKPAKSVDNNIHNGNSNETKPLKLENIIMPDTGSNGSHDRPRNAMKTKRTPSRQYHHIQSLTTTKPRNHLHASPSKIVEIQEAPTFDTSKENFGRVSYTYGSEAQVPSRLLRSTTTTTTTQAPTKSTTTTSKPTRNFVAREVSKFVDRPKATGFRGSVKFGQTTTKRPN